MIYNMKHQIILLGKDITSVYHGIKEFAPDHVHLLCTNETQQVAEPLFPLLPDSIGRTVYRTEPYNGEHVRTVCRKIHQAYPSADFAYNLSEGTKLMAFAAFTIAKEYNVPAFYLTQLGDLVWLDNFEMRPMKSKLDNKEILGLSGNVLTEYQDAKQLSDTDIQASSLIKQFIEQYPKEHTMIQKFFNIFCERDTSHLPASRVFKNGLRFKQRQGSLLIAQENHVLLRLSTPNACMLFFKGRWWETLVAHKVRTWSQRHPNRPEVWQSVIFRTEGNNPRTKNEVDVLLNNQQQLIFIECKSGLVTQNDVYKVDAVRETYGGDISLAVLASYYPVEDNLQEKCKDLQINLFAPTYIEDRIDHLNTLPAWLEKLSNSLQL